MDENKNAKITTLSVNILLRVSFYYCLRRVGTSCGNRGHRRLHLFLLSVCSAGLFQMSPILNRSF